MATVSGADVQILADLDPVPFVLDVDLLNADASVLTPTDEALSDIACQVTRASWSWGSSEWKGPLTTPDAGGAELLIADPDRKYDPGNPDAARPVQLGSPVQIRVDGAPAWTGFLSECFHDHGAGLTTLRASDAIAALAQVAYDGLTIAGTTWAVMDSILDRVGWPASLRVKYGGPAAYRTAGTDPEQGWPALVRNALAEGGLLWVDRQGRVAQSARGLISEPVESPPVIGCDGADLASLETGVDREGIRNHVQVDADDTHPTVQWSDPGSIAAYGRRTLRGKREELRLGLAP